MSWTTPRDWTAAEVVTAANLNTHLRDNMRFLGGVSGSSKPFAILWNTANVSLTSGSFTTITFDTEDRDEGACHSTVSNTGRITVPTGGDGCWLFGCDIEVETSACNKAVRLRKNGATVIAEHDITGVGTAAVIRVSTGRLIPMVATDYVECQVFQDLGSSINCTTQDRYSPVFWGMWMSL